MSCNTCQPPSSNCTPFNPCPPENYGSTFPTLVGPPGPAGGPGTYVANLAQLRLVPVASLTNGYIAQVGGHSNPFDGGGGLFSYKPSGADAENNGTIVQPASGIGRWYRIFSGPLNVRWFGATGDGTTDDLAAAQAAANTLTSGGSLSFSNGTFALKNRLLITQDNVTVFIEVGTTLLLSGWVYNGTQNPFGNQIHFTGKNCAIFGGNRTSSILQIAGGSKANAVGMLNRSNFQVLNVTIDGDKDNVTAIADDTFQSAVSFVNNSSDNPEPTSEGRLVINNCELRNFVQYGVNLYGDLASYITITNTAIHGHGKAGSALSVGSGVSISRGTNNLILSGCQIYGNKRNGVDSCSAGLAINTLIITNNIIRANGAKGIFIHEELNYSSVANVGQNGITITGNHIYSNGTEGLRIGTYDNVGIIFNFLVDGNIIRDNGTFNILVQSNAPGTNQTVTSGIIDTTLARGAVTDNGIYLDTNVRNVMVRTALATDNASAGVVDVSGLNDVGMNHITSGEQFVHVYDFVPVLIGTTSAGVGTYTDEFGKAIKIGNRVFVQIKLTWTAHTGTGDMRITGLPVAALKENALSVFASGLDAGVTDPRARTGDASTQVFLVNYDTGNIAAIPIEAAGNLVICGHYDITP